ncbi:MAG: branched-chain amino acid ABC transporter ATP-binding protein [Candidatus Syntrophoarchaeum caldarius]|uniref:Branched-chain amino acid ABC transporter ATP-binding protein n=1 Tax=Candidatus Syntropharchaeum caldarium TaxID=1838285 RepID=A0A1F2PAE2_9EURY|nr:MAG: branched-chain amino acid ABC transporter ATP-binding protein [Candidatus Syntrophoarchaeum caldarius]
MLETELLNCGYGELQVIFDLSASIERGMITAVLGPNGSGKSTFLKALSGLATIYSGCVRYEGQDVTSMPAHQRAKLGIAYLPQTNNVFSNLTVSENLQIAGYVLDKREVEDRIDAVLDLFPELEGYMHKKAGTLSGGERQFLAIGSALIRKSKILMLDEPTAHLSPKLSAIVLERISELRNKLNLTIVLVEQNVKDTLLISDYAYILVSGRVAYYGDAGALRDTPSLDLIIKKFLFGREGA